MNKFLKESKADDVIFQKVMDFWDSKQMRVDINIDSIRIYAGRADGRIYGLKVKGDVIVLANFTMRGFYKRFIKKLEAWAKKNHVTIVLEQVLNKKLRGDSISHGYKVVPMESLYGEQITLYKEFK